MIRTAALLFVLFIFISGCERPCNKPPEYNYIDEKYLAWLPDSAYNFYMISNTGIEMQFYMDTFYNKAAKQPTKNQNPVNCPVLNTESIGRTYKTTYMDEIHYNISSGFGDDHFKGNSMSITGGNFLSNFSFDNPNGVDGIQSQERSVKCEFSYISEYTVRNNKYKDVIKIWIKDLANSKSEYVDTIYTAKHHGLIYFTQKNGTTWIRK